MKVLHINTIDKGGAATACLRIHSALLERGIDSKVLVLKQTKPGLPGVYRFQHNPSLWSRALNKLKRLLSGKSSTVMEQYPEVEWFSNPTTPYDITTHPLYNEADIIQLNWVSGFLDEPSFFRKNKKPVVWRMPDLYTCGGGYHYEKGFPFQKLKKLRERNSRIRTKALENAKVTFAPISNWVREKADASAIIGHFPKQVIHNGLDFSIFKPMDKAEAREVCKLPLNKKIVLLGSDISMSKRKGIDLAIEVLEQLDNNVFQPVIFGEYGRELPSNFIHVGRINEESKLVALYNSADLFCMSSIEEAFGQVTIEALACGVPVVSFPNGGSLDIIKPGENGILANDFSSEALAEALQSASVTDWDSEAIIRDTHKRFNIQDKIEDYIQLYETILSS